MKFWPLFLIFIICCVRQVSATHIVGGEFELEHVSGTGYRLWLNMYFDNLNGDPLAQDPFIIASIFDKQTNQRLMDINMPFISAAPVAYTSIACTSESLSTSKLVYSSTLTLSPGIFNNPTGYYVVWERCCRNNIITNIIQPQNAGQAFYLEFPAVVKDNRPFLNSSPKLFPPLSDYACINDLFYYDFSGTDSDGDSLVYEMVTPLNGFSTPTAPFPIPSFPGPYPEIRWTAGLGVLNQIPGNPSVTINRYSGRLTVRPNRLGLFVFGVRCSEYRANIKIGETRRDFQLLVLDCQPNANPKIDARIQGQKNFYQTGDTIRITSSGNRCLDLFMSDADLNEALTISYRPVNFSLSGQLLNVTSGIVNQGGVQDSLKATLCFPGCLDSKGKTYLLDVMVKDDGCSLPKTDTIRLTIISEPVPDQPPGITTTADSVVLSPAFGDVILFDVIGTDPDQDLVSVSLVARNFNRTNQKISFTEASAKGKVTIPFRWEIDCNALSQASYLLDFVVTTTICDTLVTRTTTIEIHPVNSNRPPTISTLLAGQTIVIPFGGMVTDSIFGTDPDLNQIVLAAAGDGFNLADYGMQFTPATGNGSARTTFTWTPDCRALDRESFTVNFSVQEQTCQPYPAAIKQVVFRVQPEEIKSFVPANIFTPNGDGLNDYFEMPNLPPDFCGSVFATIKIFNRWGNLVYSSNNRQFKWDGQHVTDGVYYYRITFSDKEYKGHVTLVH